ncbi:hypothetical protein [Novosphingobium sp. PASSN1]|nr:hypothetical protein [Novosphingobium sp. PASSN1]
MKIKTNLRAGAKSGTVASGGKSSSTDSTSVSTPDSTPVVVVYTRCAGL